MSSSQQSQAAAAAEAAQQARNNTLRSNINNAQRSINNHADIIVDLRALLIRLESVQTQNQQDTQRYQLDMDTVGECTSKVEQIQHVRLATWGNRELSQKMTGNARDNADTAIVALSSLIINEIERVEQEIRNNENAISAFEGQIAFWRSQIS